MNGVHEHGDVFRGRELGDAVAQVENVAGVGAVGIEHFFRFGGNGFGTNSLDRHFTNDYYDFLSCSDPGTSIATPRF